MSFRLQLIISIVLLLAITFGIGGTLLISASFQTSLDEQTDTAFESYETVLNTLSLLNTLTEQTDHDSLADALKQMEERGITFWQALVLETDEHVIYENGSPNSLAFSLPVPPDNQCCHVTVSDDYGHGLLILSTISAEEEQLFLKARFDLSPVYTARETQQHLFFIIYLVVVPLGGMTSAILAFILTRRLKKLTAAVRRISGGDLDTRSSIRSHDEFGQLSRDFDTMADHLQENIRRLEQDMQRQEAFMGAFAHELKTPMTSIIGYADLLRQDNMDDNTRMMAADYIFSEGQRLEKLSFKLLDLLMLKKDAPVMREVNLSVFLLEVEKALSPVLRQKNIHFVCRADRVKVVFEPDLVKSLLYNLADNASKAIESDGAITILGEAIPGGCQFQVIDNGRGIAESELDKITEAFYRVDKSRSRMQGGVGLGLTLCKEITALHHGSLKFDSSPGAGTRVTVTLYGSEGDEHA